MVSVVTGRGEGDVRDPPLARDGSRGGTPGRYPAACGCVRPADQPEVEGAVAAARASLGEAPFEEAWATGQRRSLAQIVARVVAGSEADVATAEAARREERATRLRPRAPGVGPSGAAACGGNCS